MRQKPIENYIVDFYCSKLKLVIEIDGDSHIGKEAEDALRQKEIERLGISFLRFDDLTVKKNMDSVLMTIQNWIRQNKIIKYSQPPCPLSNEEQEIKDDK